MSLMDGKTANYSSLCRSLEARINSQGSLGVSFFALPLEDGGFVLEHTDVAKHGDIHGVRIGFCFINFNE